jgi:ubiquitin-activating enzyme E1
VYECAKNLALSGVGSIVIMKADDNEVERGYHYPAYDDLGQSYMRAARSELEVKHDVDEYNLLQMYLQRLNPSVKVIVSTREKATNGVLIAIDRPHSTQVQLNAKCRESNVKFVSMETAGVYAKVFCDFGSDFEVFDSDGEPPVDIPLDRLEVLQEEQLLQVKCIEGEKHDVSKGDIIEFRLAAGETRPGSKCKVVQVKSPTQVTLEFQGDSDITEFCELINDSAVSFRRIKVPTVLQFETLESIISEAYSNDSLVAVCDLDKTFDTIRRAAILSAFRATEAFVQEYGDLPTKETSKEFIAVSKVVNSQQPSTDSKWKGVVGRYARTCKGKLCPVQAVIGAIGAQEALKAVSGLYSPIRQFLLFDCEEVLSKKQDMGAISHANTSGHSYVLGEAIVKRISSQRIFVVGAGAIGCELLKNLAAMGSNRIIVTDMDTIEKSNLSRQLLFRDNDIGSFKSVAAKKGVLRYNSNAQMEVHTSKVGNEEGGPFDDKFWSKRVDVVLNALDNVDARLFVDSQCVAYQKALIDAGTLGSKGNVQVVVPFQSESYGSSVDPPEPAIPVCTLKNFPFLISHTIQWGRDLFEGYFTKRPQQTNDLTKLLRDEGPRKVEAKLQAELGKESSVESARDLLEDLEATECLDLPEWKAGALRWAVRCADKLFRQQIEVLLREHPVDSVDEDGEPFWSGSRRTPTPVTFREGTNISLHQQRVNDNLVSFIQSCARLRLEALNPLRRKDYDTQISREEAMEALLGGATCEKGNQDASVETLLRKSSQKKLHRDPEWVSVDFEKDDEANGHVDFVTAASNLRALCYGIAPATTMETRRVAGQIVPAMITTTAAVSALSCLELIKLGKGSSLEVHRNSFINLALPFFAFTRPVPAEQVTGSGGRTFTLWDRTHIKESKKMISKGGMSLAKLLTLVLEKAGLDSSSFQISSIAYGPYLIYASFIHDQDKEFLQQPVLEVIANALVADGDEFAGRDENSQGLRDEQVMALKDKRYIDLSVIIEEVGTGTETEIPPVRLERILK